MCFGAAVKLKKTKPNNKLRILENICEKQSEKHERKSRDKCCFLFSGHDSVFVVSLSSLHQKFPLESERPFSAKFHHFFTGGLHKEHFQ